MKNAFSLYTFFLNVYAGLRLGCTESHAKNITSLENYFFNFHFFYFTVLEKSLTFSVHLYTFCAQPLLPLAAIGVQRAFFLCTPLYTALFCNFANI
jgi:hypothetical protein